MFIIFSINNYTFNNQAIESLHQLCGLGIINLIFHIKNVRFRELKYSIGVLSLLHNFPAFSSPLTTIYNYVYLILFLTLQVDCMLPSKRHVYLEACECDYLEKDLWGYRSEMFSISMGFKSSNKCLKRREKEKRLTEDRWCEERGRDRSCSYKPRKPRMASSHQGLGERQGTEFPSECAEGTDSINSLNSDLWPPKLWKNKILLSYNTQFSALCYGSQRKLKYSPPPLHPLIRLLVPQGH